MERWVGGRANIAANLEQFQLSVFTQGDDEMKRQAWPLTALVVTMMLAIVILALDNLSVTAEKGPILPTPAPTATPGNPPPNPTSVPLAQPLVTQEQALEQALHYDAILSAWSRPWSKDTLALEPDRITIQLYPNRTAESLASGEHAWFSPDVEADAGAVWAITIKGDVNVAVISPRQGDPIMIYDGVTYVISQRTGNLLTIRTGLPKK